MEGIKEGQRNAEGISAEESVDGRKARRERQKEAYKEGSVGRRNDGRKFRRKEG